MLDLILILQKVPHLNFNVALEHGHRLLPLFDEGDLAALTPARLYTLAQDKLKGFKENDGIILVGDPELMMISFHILTTFKLEKINILKYDRIKQSYKLRTYNYEQYHV